MLMRFKFVLFVVGFIALGSSHLRAQSGTTYRDGPRITCASDDGNRHYCAADTRYGVRLVNQRSGTPCRQGYSWGLRSARHLGRPGLQGRFHREDC